MIVFNDTLGAYGGSHTLMYRMCKWLSDNSISSAIICRSKDNKEIVEKLQKLGVEIICADMMNIHHAYEVLAYLMKKEPIKVVNLSWNFYLDIECVKYKYHLDFDNIVYCIHPETFKKGIGFKTKFMRNYSINKYAPIYKRMNANKAIIMMDEVDTEESNNYLHERLEPTPEIIRLPMYCNSRNDYKNIIKCGYDSNIIMTAARAEFPYKGYIIGLIADFVKLKSMYPKLKLEIITAGDDYNIVVENINKLNDCVKSDITLHGWMDYDVLKKNIERCKIFVGMGTTVLDAALLYKPSLPVRFNTYEDIGEYFIHEKPEYITPDYLCQSKAINAIEKVLKLSYNEYSQMCIDSYNSVKDNYDIEVGMKKIINVKTVNSKCILTNKEVKTHMLNNRFNMIRYRNANDFDYNKIKFEKSTVNGEDGKV